MLSIQTYIIQEKNIKLLNLIGIFINIVYYRNQKNLIFLTLLVFFFKLF